MSETQAAAAAAVVTALAEDRMESSIPFAGFYESWHSQALDDALEQLTQDDNGEQYERKSTDEESGAELVERPGEDLWQHVSYRTAEQVYVKDYVSAFSQWVKQLSKLDLQLEFQEMISPREYNFTTDRIFVTLPKSIVQEMFRRTSMSLLDQHIRDKFTSYDGFYSYYPNTLEEWLGGDAENQPNYKLKGNTDSLDEWDGNQVGTLLEAFLSQYATEREWNEFQVEFSQSADDNGELYNAMYDALDAEGKRIVDDIAKDRQARDERKRNQGGLF